MTEPFALGHALIIGVGSDLPNTVDDARGLEAILTDPERCSYPKEQVNLLTGEQATRDQVLAALDALAQKAGLEDTVVLYFSGHGYRVESPLGAFYYLMPFGYDVNALYKTAISGSEFASRLAALKASKLVILLDCCHAGGVGDAKAAGMELAKSPLPPEAHALLQEGRGRVLIASCTDDELSYAGKPYSAFTLALIEAFSGRGVAKKDGYVRVADLALHTRQMVPGRTRDRQHPVLHFEQADNFVLAYYAAGESEPKGLPFKEEPQIEPEAGAWTRIERQTNIQVGNINNQGGEVNIAGGNIVKNTHNINTAGGAYVGGTVNTGGGDFIGRDKISAPAQSDEIGKIFAAITAQVKAISNSADKEEALDLVQKLEAEFRKGAEADQGRVKRWLNFLSELAPAAAETAVVMLKGLARTF
jgi:hypothetical protein